MRIYRTALLITLVVALPAIAQNITVEADEGFQPKRGAIPFGFYNENLDFGLGAVYGTNGVWQDQMSVAIGGFGTTNGSLALLFFSQDLQLPLGDRLFLDTRFAVNRYDEFDSYVNGDFRYPFQRAGSNDSDENNYIQGEGWDTALRLTFKYLLPLGHGKDQVINTYALDRGLMVEGATGGDAFFNPLTSGRSYVELEPFYRNKKVQDDHITSIQRTNGLTLSLRYDNRDFVLNPNRGNQLRLAVSRDFGALDSNNSWTSVEGEFSQYIPLGSNDWCRQATLALNVWTSYVPTWEDNGGQPPPYTGATLGGIYRMRGFPEGRFYDKAAMYYAAELRFIPEWNPFGPGSILENLEVDWIMFAPFVEIGRVAEHWSLDELHGNMKTSAGLGFRIMAKQAVVRLDSAFSSEGMRFQVMVSHPF